MNTHPKINPFQIISATIEVRTSRGVYVKEVATVIFLPKSCGLITVRRKQAMAKLNIVMLPSNSHAMLSAANHGISPLTAVRSVCVQGRSIAQLFPHPVSFQSFQTKSHYRQGNGQFCSFTLTWVVRSVAFHPVSTQPNCHQLAGSGSNHLYPPKVHL